MWLGLLLLLLLAGLSGLGLWMTQSTALDLVAGRLGHDAETLLADLDPQRRAFSTPPPAIYRQPLSGHYLVVRFADGGLLRSRSLWDESLSIEPLPPGTRALARIEGPRGQRLLLWQAGYEMGGQSLTLGVAEDISPLIERMRRFLWLGLTVALTSLGLLFLAQRMLLRRLFRPLDQVRQEVREVTLGGRQLLEQSVPQEIQPLVEEFNLLIKARQEHLQRARHAAGNLAHALKGPLTLIYQQCRGEDNTAIALQAQRMGQLIERELQRARIAASASAGRHFQPESDLKDLIATIRALYPHKALEIQCAVSAPPSLPLEQDDLLELIGNLLDNAAKWANRQILIELLVDNALRLWLEDDGPGLSETEIERLLQRGARLDEGTPGHGLGLSIAEDICRSYGGQLRLGRSQRLRGLRVELVLPLTQAP